MDEWDKDKWAFHLKINLKADIFLYKDFRSMEKKAFIYKIKKYSN